MAFYIERLIPKLVPAKDTLRVRRRDTSSFDTPVVTVLGEGARQKILIHQVFNRSVKVWVRYEGLSSIRHLPYPWSGKGFSRNKISPSKNRDKKTGKFTVCQGDSGQGDVKKLRGLE